MSEHLPSHSVQLVLDSTNNIETHIVMHRAVASESEGILGGVRVGKNVPTLDSDLDIKS
jgi:hypothetical protein